MSAAGHATATSVPNISIILPLRAGLAAPALAAALARLKAQPGGPHEAILLADAAAPAAATRALAEQARALLPEALIVAGGGSAPTGLGDAGEGLARGLRAARGDFVTFLEPTEHRGGDRWTDGALPALARGFREAPGVDAVQGLVRQREPAGAEARRSDAPDSAAFAGGRPSPPYPGQRAGALLLRRAALLAAIPDTLGARAPGPGAPDAATAPDRALFRRLAALGLRRLVIPDVVLEHPGPPGPEALEGTAPWTEPAPAPGALPAYSVILVVKEGRRYLPAALASLRRQSVAPAEILAIVAPSGDGTLDYLRAQPDVRAVAQSGSGLAQARNQGLALARSEVIAFLDHDDLWQPRKLERQLAVLGRFAGPAACITRFRLVRDVDGEDSGVAAPAAAPSPPVAPPGQLPRLGWTPSALVAHRAVFRQVGAFDPATGMGCDTDWFFRLRRAAAPCGLAPEVLLDKRLHAGNLSRDNRENRAALFRVIRKNREG